jgi:hypothetical protein
MTNFLSFNQFVERLIQTWNIQIEKAEADGSVVFHDGSVFDANVIIHCTG